jgi:hypothetical protein
MLAEDCRIWQEFLLMFSTWSVRRCQEHFDQLGFLLRLRTSIAIVAIQSVIDAGHALRDGGRIYVYCGQPG